MFEAFEKIIKSSYFLCLSGCKRFFVGQGTLWLSAKYKNFLNLLVQGLIDKVTSQKNKNFVYRKCVLIFFTLLILQVTPLPTANFDTIWSNVFMQILISLLCSSIISYEIVWVSLKIRLSLQLAIKITNSSCKVHYASNCL